MGDYEQIHEAISETIEGCLELEGFKANILGNGQQGFGSGVDFIIKVCYLDHVSGGGVHEVIASQLSTNDSSREGANISIQLENGSVLTSFS